MADLAVSGARDAPGRLPRPRTSFVGRESELAQARHLLGHNRLVTLTGPGGCGKNEGVHPPGDGSGGIDEYCFCFISRP